MHTARFFSDTQIGAGLEISAITVDACHHCRLRTRLDEIFRAWKGQLAACIDEAKVAGELPQELDSGVLAGFILSGLEGAMLQAKVMKSPQPMEDFIATLFATVLKKT